MRSFLRLSSKLFIGSVVCIFVFVIGSVSLNRLRGFQTKPDPILGTAISIPNVTPTPTSAPKPKVEATTTKVTNNDPIITCTSSHPNCMGQSIKVKQSACSNIYCCGLNGTWSVYATEALCRQAAQGSQNSTNTNSTSYTYPTYTPPVYYICTLCYHSLGTCTTYDHLYKTKAECDQRQAEINAIGGSPSYNNPTPQPTLDVDAYNARVSQCQSDVVHKYGNIEINCNALYGDSSATEACISIKTGDRQKEYNACGTKL